MKCVICVQYQYQNNTRPTMFESIQRAHDAVTVWNGDALCVDHLAAIQIWRSEQNVSTTR